jgi:hypothetical protein
MDWKKELSALELNKWAEVMLQHPFDEEDWFHARTSLLKLLSSDQKTAQENTIRSYLSCCAESVGATHPLPSLQESVIELYKQYGMDEANDNSD